MGRSPIYLDYNATTPVDPRVADIVMRYMVEAFGNASSADHSFGDEAQAAVSDAAAQVAALVGSEPESVVFTSGSTESANIALRGLAGAIRASRDRPLRVALMPVEHPAVLDTCADLARQELAELVWLGVDQRARLDLEQLEAACARGLDLACVMAANNEVGTLYPLRQVAAVAHEHGALVFTDATQAAGKIPIDMEEWGIDLAALSGHKIYGPKGVGALVVGGGLRLDPPLTGGGQQRGLRPGTLNVPGIAGLGEACRLRREEMSQDEPRNGELRDLLQELLEANIPSLVVNGDTDHRLAGTLHVSVPGVPNHAIIARVRDRVAISTGSACSSGIEAPSHVLRAMGLNAALLEGALRISLGKFTTGAEVEEAADVLIRAVHGVELSLRTPSAL